MEKHNLQSAIESILFIETKPLTLAQLAKLTHATPEEVRDCVETLHQAYAERNGGMVIVIQDNKVQMTTAPDYAEFVGQYLKEETTGELTRPSLETLTIIAYRGPVPKTEIELIRGVNCSLILRNLLIRGLIEEIGETETGTPVYQTTIEFLRYVGVSKASDLPNYKELNENVHLQELLQKQSEDFFTE